MNYHKRDYVHLAEFSPDFILSELGDIRRDFVVGDKIFSLSMKSIRLATFAKSRVCACCGLKGTRMMLDIHPNDKATLTPHFNLYGECPGGLVLMTKDHIIPKTKGGKDCLNNLQTMCTFCNEMKRNTIFSVDELKILPEILEWMRYTRGSK